MKARCVVSEHGLQPKCSTQAVSHVQLSHDAVSSVVENHMKIRVLSADKWYLPLCLTEVLTSA